MSSLFNKITIFLDFAEKKGEVVIQIGRILVRLIAVFRGEFIFQHKTEVSQGVSDGIEF